MAEIPAELRYTQEHEYVKATDDADVVQIGITDFAQDALGDIVYVDLPPVGTAVTANQTFGEVESTKSVSDIYSPVTGTIVERNDELDKSPELINSDPYGQGWLFSKAVPPDEISELLVGGPPVYPPIPEGVLSLGQVKRTWPLSKGGDRYRRGLYTFVFRATPPPGLSVFDAPDGFSTCTRRLRSNTPLQALTLLNDSAFVEFAQALEKIIEKDGVEAAFQRCTARRPTPEELATLGSLDAQEIARVLLNLDETITRE